MRRADRETEDGARGLLGWVGGPLALMWVLEALDWLLGGRLDGLGIVPRRLEGLRGVLLAPWLHVSFGHLAANTPPLALFGSLLLLARGRRAYVRTWAYAMGIGGLGTWLLGDLLGPVAVHIGASGVVFGMLGFLMTIGLLERRLGSALLSALVTLGYAGMLWGLLPIRPGVSWEGHLFGLLGGVAAARAEARRARAGAKRDTTT